jgi:8-oxo-dGTP diphosphatase
MVAMLRVTTHDPGELKDLRFVVIFAGYQNQWLYTRHRERSTWETAGGHIEEGETAIAAARRELYEETGAVDFSIVPVLDYSVHSKTGSSNGRVFHAQVKKLTPLPESEMCEVKLFGTVPEEMTYPQILPVLYEKMREVFECTRSK